VPNSSQSQEPGKRYAGLCQSTAENPSSMTTSQRGAHSTGHALNAAGKRPLPCPSCSTSDGYFGEATKLHGYKAARLQGCKAARLHGHRAAKLQGCRAACPEGCKAARLHGCKATTQGYNARLQGYAATRLLNCKGTRLQGHTSRVFTGAMCAAPAAGGSLRGSPTRPVMASGPDSPG
jgi:hypothetical protein